MLWFSDSSVGKESTCNAGDPGSNPASGISAGEGIGYPLQSSLVAQLVKNQTAMEETWVWSLGWEHPLEKGKTTHSTKAWRIPWTVYKESNMTEWLSLLQFFNQIFWSWITNEWSSQVMLVVKNLSASARNVRLGFDPWVWKIPWRSAWQPTSVFLPGESYGQSILVGYSP